MNKYEFTMTFSGYGKTPAKGWTDAVDTIMGDSHFEIYQEDEMETKLVEENIDY